MKGLKTALAAVLASCLCVSATAQTSTIHSRSNLTVASSANMERIHPNSRMSMRDRRFVGEIAKGNMGEVALGKLAERNGGEWGRAFGRDMQREHTLALESLKPLARRDGLMLPTRLDAKTLQEINRLSRYHGAEFDRMYRQLMLQDHREDLGVVQGEMRSGRNSKIRSYAVMLEPAIKMHLKMAQQQTTMTGHE